MSTIRNVLQKEVFDPHDERLLALCNVGKLLKKKKSSILCVATTVQPPATITIVQIKQTDKTTFKRKRSWSLIDLKAVDSKDASDQNFLEFDLQLDKMYRWVALNAHERQAFIVTLWRQSVRYVVKDKPKFRNVPKDWLREDVLTPDSNFESSPLCLDVDFQDIQPITDKEQEDLSKLMSDCEYAISNAEAFMEYLARDLSLLEGENVQRLLASEVETIMQQLDVAIGEAERIEGRLDGYDEILCHVKNTMEEMGKKNTKIAVANKNNILLLKELERIVTQLNLPVEYQRILENADFTSAEGIRGAVEASGALKEALNADIDPALLEMAAVQEQRRKFLRCKDLFSMALTRQLNNLFIHYGNHKGDVGRAADGFSLPQHGAVHRELRTYAELMHWAKVMDRKAYDHLRKLYTESLGKLYERDVRRLFDIARENIGVISGTTLPARTVALLGLDSDQWVSEPSPKERNNFKTTLDKLLTQLEPVCLQEQMFCVSFFQLDILSPTTKNTQTTLDGVEESAIYDRKADKRIDEDVRKVMNSLFACLEEELLNFLGCIEKQDSFYSMYVLVCLNQHVMSAKSSFLSNTYASVLIHVKRSLDRFMQLQLDSIRDCKIPRKQKCGILPYVVNLEEFHRNADVLLKSERRADLEKWYTRLIDAIIDCVAAHSVEHGGKSPQQVVRIENYHRLHSMLSQMKISVLDAQRKEAKQRYNDSLAAYVTLYFGRPLEKLNTFFDGVQARVSSGVKVSEVSYQLAFSKQELRKVIGQYPESAVKRGLEALYKKVEKHLSEESNLLPVVWRAMQEEFIQQYKTLEDLIQQCYPGSMINLEFTIEDILNFFSDIARSH